MKKSTIMSRINASRIPNTAIIFLLFAPLVVIFYGFFVFNPFNADNILLYAFQVCADIIGMITILSLWITIFLDVFVSPYHRVHVPHSSAFLVEEHPTVDVLITTAGEPFEVVKKTVLAAIAIEYPHQTFLLDDVQSPDLRRLATELNIHYVTRATRIFAKAGNINNGLQYAHGDFFSIFDADQVPKPEFLTVLLPYMKNKKIAMVQSPQHFVNTQYFISSGTAQAQEVFYKYLCPAKNISDSVFCVGTNMVFRRKAIESIGGIAQVSHSEDIWTSRLLHEEGWKTLFVNEILANGEAPHSISSYFRQQLRWAKGGLSMLFIHNSFNSTTLSIDQKFQYFFANMFYLVGFSMAVYIMLPLIYLLFGASPLHITSTANWLLHYLPYFALYYSLSWILLGKLQISTISTSLASFWPYMLAFFSIVFGTKYDWKPTTSQHSQLELMMKWIWPHVFLIILTIFSVIVGWFEPRDFWQTFFITIWAVWNMYLLVLFITSDKKIMHNQKELV